jgi:hypothetical protein
MEKRINDLVEMYLTTIDEIIDEHNHYNGPDPYDPGHYDPGYNEEMATNIIKRNITEKLDKVTKENFDQTVEDTMDDINHELHTPLKMGMDSDMLPNDDADRRFIRRELKELFAIQIRKKKMGIGGRKSRRSRHNKSRRNKSRRHRR